MKRQFGNLEFDFVYPIQPDLDENGRIQTFLPQSQYKKRAQSRLHAYGEGPFCRFRIPPKLSYQGVYILTLDDEPYYVGECEDLSKRYNMGYGQISPRNCYAGGQPTNCRLNHLIYLAARDGKKVDLWFMPTGDRFAVEAALIQQLQTRQRWNRKD